MAIVIFLDENGNPIDSGSGLAATLDLMKTGATITATGRIENLNVGEVPIFQYSTNGTSWSDMPTATLIETGAGYTKWQASMPTLYQTTYFRIYLLRDGQELYTGSEAFDVTNVIISPEAVALAIGETTSLTAVAVYEDNSTADATGSLIWQTSDPTVATVEQGFITAIKTGQVTITAVSGLVADSITVTIEPAMVPGIPVVAGGFCYGGKPYGSQTMPASDRIRETIVTTYEVVREYSIKEQINTTFEVINEYSIKVPINTTYEVINDYSVKIPILTTYSIIGTTTVPPDSKSITFTGTLQPGDELVIDMKDMTAKLNGTNVLNLIEGAFFALLAGENVLAYEDQSSSRTITIEVTKRTRTLV